MHEKNGMIFLFQSEPGDFIGQGRTEEYTAADTACSVIATDRNYIRFTIERGEDRWSIEFAAPKSQRLKVGMYERATPCAFHADGEPGFTMSGNGRASNKSFGGFIIRKIRFNNSGLPVLLQAQFAQRSELTDAPTLFGELYYRNYRPSKKKTASGKRTLALTLLPRGDESRHDIAMMLLD
jgi:hypothetical protein